MKNFSEFGLAEPILKAIQDLGFTEASPIQQQTIPLLVNEETDIIGLAQTGTGKTAAFGLPLLQNIKDDGTNHIQAVIISPTRELCIQLEEEVVKYSKYLHNVSSVAVYGGTPIGTQIRAIKRQNPQIIVATPGRLIDLIQKGVVHLDQTHTVVLDEADEMLNMGFRDDIEAILQEMPEERQVWLFSATMNNDVRRIAKRFMHQPKEVAVARENVGNENIQHQYFVINHHQRFEALKRLLDLVPEIYGIIFTRTKQDAHVVAENLMKEGYHVSPLHGDMDQQMRSKVMERFKNRHLQVIVATDVAARGIDVNDISHVINYELPEDPEVYTHRSGRTGRAGRSGICMSLVTSREMGRLRQVERIAKTKFEKHLVPNGDEVVQKKIHFILDEIVASEPQMDFAALKENAILEKLTDFSSEELIEKLLWMQLKQTIENYQHAQDLNVGHRRRGEEEQHDQQGKTVRMYLNLGSKDGLNPGSLVKFLTEMTDIEGNLISRVTIRELSSFFNIPFDASEFMMQVLRNQRFNGRRIRIEEADSKPNHGRGGGGGGHRKGGNFNPKGPRRGTYGAADHNNKGPSKAASRHTKSRR